MAFTQDEIQSFNTILDAKLAQHRREMQQLFDQRLGALKREFEQRLLALQQELHARPYQFAEQQSRLGETLGRRLDLRQQQYAERVEHAIDARFLAIEQLLRQNLTASDSTPATYDNEGAAHGFEAIEVQTEIPWEDLVEVVDKAVGARLAALDESIQATLRRVEHYLAVQLRSLRDALASGAAQSYSGRTSNTQDILASIEHLERIVESMHVAMTTNHALLSNRLYHHQQTSLERAHPHADDHAALSNGVGPQLPHSEEQEDQRE